MADNILGLSLKNGLVILGCLIGVTMLSGIVLKASITKADVEDEVSIVVPISCTMSGVGMNTHTAQINNGQYDSSIGETTVKTMCNDSSGFAIYAIGYSGEIMGNNKLISNTASTNDIATGTAISGQTSNWAMKLSTVTSPTPTYPITVQNFFDSFQSIPDDYTLVAKRISGTDVGVNAEGSTFKTTYQAYISPTQPAGTYDGKVKYVLVHPNDQPKPIAFPATLDTGKTVNSKLKSLAATVVTGEETTIVPTFIPWNDRQTNAKDTYIKSINVHLKTPAPADFTPSSANTISSADSMKPIYIIFDNTDNAGVMHFYTEGEQIVLPTDSSYMFYLFRALVGISGISDWDTSNVTNMEMMFVDVSFSATTFNLDLSSWDTSSVTDMSAMFCSIGYSATAFNLNLSSWDTSSVEDMEELFIEAGYSATTWSIQGISSWDTSSAMNTGLMFAWAGYSASTFSLDLSSWDVSNVTEMFDMFEDAGYSASTFSLDVSSWDTSSVEDMNWMFSEAGYSATTFILDLSSWDTFNVKYMDEMFSDAGHSATTWSVTIPRINGGNISNTTSRIYGQTTSVYGTPLSGKSFTLAPQQ